ncbi:MAG: TlpA disulfide reductase family protein [Thermoanaerobaculaceae bacterium]|jgi:thiol-disulfide isomerase/thioredoxin
MRALSLCFAGVAVLTVALVRGEPARQEFPPIQLTDLAGQTVELRNLLGTATVLNFWATWCGPCRLELPELQKLYNELGGKGLVLLAVDVDLPALLDEEGVAQQLAAAKPRLDGFLKKTGITLPVYLVDGKTQAALGVEQIPFSILLDRKGGVVRIYPGYSAESVADLRRHVLGILAESSGQGGR